LGERIQSSYYIALTRTFFRYICICKVIRQSASSAAEIYGGENSYLYR
jgi:hypothetical protein